MRALTRTLGNIALLGIAGELGLVPAAIAQRAADAYREYRRLQHQIRLTGAPQARVDPDAQADTARCGVGLRLMVRRTVVRRGASRADRAR